MTQFAKDLRLVEAVRSQFQKSEITVEIPKDAGDFPALTVTIPDSWPHVDLAPLYDVHIGHQQHDGELFNRHLEWMAAEKYVITFDGGDLIENATKLSIGAGVYEQDFMPQNQLVVALQELAKIRHKMLFKLPGNHEDRANILGLDVGQWMSWILDISYFPDYCMCTIKWRGNSFRLMAHHGTGRAVTPGAQRIASRRMVGWACSDIYWIGHLHNPLVDTIYQVDIDQKTGERFERSAVSIISPSYLKFFGTYAAKKMMMPGGRGLAVVRLQEDGRIDSEIHARGRRL